MALFETPNQVVKRGKIVKLALDSKIVFDIGKLSMKLNFYEALYVSEIGKTGKRKSRKIKESR